MSNPDLEQIRSFCISWLTGNNDEAEFWFFDLYRQIIFTFDHLQKWYIYLILHRIFLDDYLGKQECLKTDSFTLVETINYKFSVKEALEKIKEK